MKIRVDHDIDDLANDLAGIVPRAIRDLRSTVRQAAIVGNTVAKDNARRTAGKHAKLYPRTFSWEMATFYGFGGGEIVAEYGPEAHGQGLLASYLEHGTRNNPPHNDLAKSADLMGPALQGEVRRLPDRWFW
jgi:hypothetical protein